MSQLKVDDIVDAAGTGSPTFSNGFKGSQSAAAGPDANTTLTSSSDRVQIVAPTANRTYTLPSAGINRGDTFVIVDTSGSFTVQVDASDASTVATVAVSSNETFMALQDTPTTNSHWITLY